MMKPRHGDGSIDRRYTVRLEFTGAAKARNVVRFDGERIGDASSQAAAWALALDHNVARLESLS